MSRRLLASVVAGCALLLVAAVAALAYYTSAGVGTASAGVGTLPAPTLTATPGAAAVALSWTPVTAPGPGTVTYYVKRDGANASAACPGSAAPTSATSCTDTGVSLATHSYTVTAVWRSWTATSASVNAQVTYGAVTQLVYTTQPSGASGGTAFTTQPVVTAEDSANHVVANYAGSVTLSIKSGTGTGGAALTNCSGALANGVTTFSNCQIDKSGSSYKLTATDGTRSVDSAAFNVGVGPVAQLAFTTQPSGASGGTAFSTQPVLKAQDAGGNTVTSYSGTVTLTLNGNPNAPGAAMTNCTRSASNGVISYSNCEIDKAATGYQLHAADNQSHAVDSAAFNVAVGSVAQLAFTTQPSGGTGGSALTTQPVVTAQDAGGNTVTSYNSTVNLSLRNANGATLSGCSGTRVSGVTTFSGCAVDLAGSGYQLRATDSGFRTVDSATFSVTVGPLAQLAVTTQPSGATAGSAFTTQPKVTAQDAGGNTVTSYGGTVTLSIKTNPGGGTLTGCTSSRSNGVVSFSGCKLDKSGSYVLTATDTALTVDTNAFTVAAGPVATLSFTTQPAGASSGAAFTTQPVVTALDANGNVATSYSGTITLSIKSGTGSGSATLSGCSGNRVSGVVTFSGCKIDKKATGYVLHAADNQSHAVDSAAFDVTVGPATQFVVSAADTTPAATAADALTITAKDAGGNTATTYTGAHSLTFGGASTSLAGTVPTVTSSAGSAVAFGTAETINFTNGVATVSGSSNGSMKLYAAETTTIAVTDGTIDDDGSLTVTVGPGSPAKLAWTSVTVSAGTLSSPCYFTCTDTHITNNGTFSGHVSVTDADGNVVSGVGSGHTVTFAVTSGSGSFTTPSGGSFTLPSSGAATTSQFTFRAQSGSWSTNAFKASSSPWSDATATVTK